MATVAEQIQELYIGLLGRAADEAGADYWKGQIDSGAMTIGQVRANIVQSQPEYKTGLGAMSREDALTELYNRLFERAPDAAGLAYWSTGDGAAATFDQLVLALVNGASTEDKAVLANKTEAAVYYTAAAGTNYTDASAKAATDSVDATAQSVTDSKNTTDTSFPSGSTFALTTDADPIVGTSANDVITGAAGTLNGTDLISDASTTDNDTLNVTLETADFGAQATISNIENINVSIDEFTGGAGTVDATNISGATITLASSKLGFDGVASVLVAGDNNVTAGTNVTDLTVTDIEAGVINAGSATTVTLNTLGATDVLNVIANGDLTLANAGTADAVVLTVTAAAEVDVQGAADLTVEGAVDVTLIDADSLTTQTITNNLTAGTLTAVIANNADASSWTVDNVQVATNALTLTSSGAIVTEVTDDAVVTYTVVGGDAAVDTATISTATDMTTLTATTGLLSAAVNVTAAATIGTLNTAAIDTTLNIAADVTISTLTATGEVSVTGTGDLTVTNTTAENIDASGLTGALKMTNAATGGNDIEITGGSGDNEIFVGDVTASVTGGAGNDTVDAVLLSTNTESMSVALGAGDDVVILTNAKKTVALDFGTGTADQLTLTDGADLTESTLVLSLVGLDIIEVQENGSTDVTAAMLASDLTGQSYAVSANDDDADGGALNLTVDVLAADTTVDLGSLVLTNVDSVVIDASLATSAVAITGTSTADTITGSTNADAIIAGAGNDEIATNGGADTIDLSAGGANNVTVATTESNASTVVAVTGFAITTDSLTGDTLTLAVDSTDNVADATVQVDIDGDGTDDYDATALDGVISYTALTAGGETAIADIDDLVTIFAATTDAATSAELGAIEWAGDTYVFSETTGDVIDSGIQLVGVTGVVALGTAQAADTLVFA